MRYYLTIYCDECGNRGRGFLVNRRGQMAVRPPDLWGHVTWPDGNQSVCCSQQCAEALTRAMGRSYVDVRKFNRQSRPERQGAVPVFQVGKGMVPNGPLAHPFGPNIR